VGSSRIAIKFRRPFLLPYQDHQQKFLHGEDRRRWDALFGKEPQANLNRRIRSLPVRKIEELADKAAKLDPTYAAVRPNFETFYRIEFGRDVTGVEDLAKLVRTWPTVEDAYVEIGEKPASGYVAATDPRVSCQGYLNPAPMGINAKFAWTIAGGDGAGQDFLLIDFGYFPLPDYTVTDIHTVPLTNDQDKAHGANALAVVCAMDNSQNGIGIAPYLSSRKFISSIDAPGSTTSDTGNAVLLACSHLSFGGILLLETEMVSGFPVEVDIFIYHAILLATALGIVCVEPAGNGGHNFDTYEFYPGVMWLAPGSQYFRDSGAIIVGSAHAATRAALKSGASLLETCYGSRVNCYAWGDNVYAYASDTGQLSCPNDFSHTSSASAIITGAASLVQGIAQATGKLNGWQMRSVLSDTSTGTISADFATYWIGVMPDLRRIIEQNKIVLDNDIYVRDNLADNGDRHSGPLAKSPDIILRNSLDIDPQASFGEGSGTEGDDALSSATEFGQDNFVYVRVRNRGLVSATDVKATVYWSPPATLVSGDLWNLIGSIDFPPVPPNNILTVSAPIIWNSADVPPAGHYCFVALVGNKEDPAPLPAKFVDFDRFMQYVRDNNNVTWRNFNVVDNLASATIAGLPGEYVSLPFLMPGAPGVQARMRLEIVANCPKGTTIWLESKDQRVTELWKAKETSFQTVGEFGYVRIASGKKVSQDSLLLNSKDRVHFRLLVNIPKELRKEVGEIYVQQLFGREVLGRVTWRLVEKK
jgi:serine protease